MYPKMYRGSVLRGGVTGFCSSRASTSAHSEPPVAFRVSADGAPVRVVCLLMGFPPARQSGHRKIA